MRTAPANNSRCQQPAKPPGIISWLACQSWIVPRAGFEPATYPLGGDRAIQLCHRGMLFSVAHPSANAHHVTVLQGCQDANYPLILYLQADAWCLSPNVQIELPRPHTAILSRRQAWFLSIREIRLFGIGPVTIEIGTTFCQDKPLAQNIVLIRWLDFV